MVELDHRRSAQWHWLIKWFEYIKNICVILLCEWSMKQRYYSQITNKCWQINKEKKVIWKDGNAHLENLVEMVIGQSCRNTLFIYNTLKTEGEQLGLMIPTVINIINVFPSCLLIERGKPWRLISRSITIMSVDQRWTHCKVTSNNVVIYQTHILLVIIQNCWLAAVKRWLFWKDCQVTSHSSLQDIKNQTSFWKK